MVDHELLDFGVPRVNELGGLVEGLGGGACVPAVGFHSTQNNNLFEVWRAITLWQGHAVRPDVHCRGGLFAERWPG